jgi:hypothetical protein
MWLSGLPVALLVFDGEGHGLDRLAEPVEPWRPTTSHFARVTAT